MKKRSFICYFHAKRKICKFSVLFFLALALAAIYPLRGLAENSGLGLAISPPLFEETIKPGQSFSSIITVTNPTSTNLRLKITTDCFFGRGEEGEIDFDSVTGQTTCLLNSWIKVANEVGVGAGESVEVPFEILVPDGSEAGGQNAVIFFEPSIENDLSAAANSAAAKIGSLLLIEVPGEACQSGGLDNFYADKKFYLNSKNTVDFTTKFNNSGQAYQKPKGEISITNVFGKRIDTLAVNGESSVVLPGISRKFSSVFQRNYYPGFYRAEVRISDGCGGEKRQKTTFWVTPIGETVALFLIILLAARRKSLPKRAKRGRE